MARINAKLFIARRVDIKSLVLPNKGYTAHEIRKDRLKLYFNGTWEIMSPTPEVIRERLDGERLELYNMATKRANRGDARAIVYKHLMAYRPLSVWDFPSYKAWEMECNINSSGILDELIQVYNNEFPLKKKKGKALDKIEFMIMLDRAIEEIRG